MRSRQGRGHAFGGRPPTVATHAAAARKPTRLRAPRPRPHPKENHDDFFSFTFAAVLRQPHGRQPLGHLHRAGRPRGALPRPLGALVRNAQAAQTRADRRRAHRNGQRRRGPLRGISRTAQPEPRPGQGRRALSPRRDAGRSDGAERLDDCEMRRRQPALLRRQRRHPRRPESAVTERA